MPLAEIALSVRDAEEVGSAVEMLSEPVEVRLWRSGSTEMLPVAEDVMSVVDETSVDAVSLAESVADAVRESVELSWVRRSGSIEKSPVADDAGSVMDVAPVADVALAGSVDNPVIESVELACEERSESGDVPVVASDVMEAEPVSERDAGLVMPVSEAEAVSDALLSDVAVASVDEKMLDRASSEEVAEAEVRMSDVAVGSDSTLELSVAVASAEVIASVEDAEASVELAPSVVRLSVDDTTSDSKLVSSEEAAVLAVAVSEVEGALVMSVSEKVVLSPVGSVVVEETSDAVDASPVVEENPSDKTVSDEEMLASEVVAVSPSEETVELIWVVESMAVIERPSENVVPVNAEEVSSVVEAIAELLVGDENAFDKAVSEDEILASDAVAVSESVEAAEVTPVDESVEAVERSSDDVIPVDDAVKSDSVVLMVG